MVPELLTPFRPDTDDVVQHRSQIALATQLAMICNREPVCLIADALYELERLAVARQHDRLGIPLGEYELELLGEADDRYILMSARIADDIER